MSNVLAKLNPNDRINDNALRRKIIKELISIWMDIDKSLEVNKAKEVEEFLLRGIK